MNGEDSNDFVDYENEEDRDGGTKCTDGTFGTDTVKHVDNRKVINLSDLLNGSTSRIKRPSEPRFFV